MIDNIIKTDFLIGKNKEEVAEMLGKVQWLSWNFNTNNFDPNVWNYGLGLIPGAFNQVKEDVKIVFSNDKVIKVVLSQSDYTYEDKKEESNKILDSINNKFNSTK